MMFFCWTETGTEEDTEVIPGTPEEEVLEEEEGRTDLHTGKIIDLSHYTCKIIDLIHHGEVSKVDSLVRTVTSLQGGQERLQYQMMC